MGFDCYAVENNTVNNYFLEKLKRAGNRHFTVIKKSIFEYDGVKKLTFDVVLALNIFHHFLKTKTTYTKLITLLRELSAKEMYFQPHLHDVDKVQMQYGYKDFSESDFVDFILQFSKFNEAKLIGIAEDGRKIYKFY